MLASELVMLDTVSLVEELYTLDNTLPRVPSSPPAVISTV